MLPALELIDKTALHGQTCCGYLLPNKRNVAQMKLIKIVDLGPSTLPQLPKRPIANKRIQMSHFPMLKFSIITQGSFCPLS